MENNLKNQHYKNMSIMLQMEILTFEAESVAYVVCNHFGLDTSEYSFSYIASWSSGKNMKELRASMDTIRKTSADMIGQIEEKLKELHIERPEQEVTAVEQTEELLSLG